MYSLALAGFFRFNELSNMKARPHRMARRPHQNNVPRSKTDIYREGNIVYIQRKGGVYCPVTFISHYMRSAGAENDTPNFLFHPCTGF